MPSDDLKRADEIKTGGRERRHMQRLADMAGGVWSLSMMVKESATDCEVQQRRKSKKSRGAAPSTSP